jgi:NitT/TauT family transport system permease protein
VENICRSDGGIGVILNDQNKHFHYDAIYGIQILILLLGMFLDFMLGVTKRFLFPYSTLKSQQK